MGKMNKSRVSGWILVLLLAVAGGAPSLAAESVDSQKGVEWNQDTIEWNKQLAENDQLADSEKLAGGVQFAQSKDNEDDVNDPLEPLNRIVFTFNEGIRVMILGPLVLLYEFIFPDIIQKAIGAAIGNLKSPVILANDLLQGEGTRAWQTTQRFLINSTIGLAGFIDVADRWLEIPKHDEDFGQTLAVWGVGEWFYLIVPIFGPSNPRDLVGRLVVDSYFDPLNLYLTNTDQEEYIYLRSGVTAVHRYSEVKSELDQIRKTSVDFYAALRSMYRQKRQAEINNGSIVDLPPIPDLSYDWERDGIIESEGNAEGPSKSRPDEMSESKPRADEISEAVTNGISWNRPRADELSEYRPVLKIVPVSDWEDRDRL